MQVSLVNKQQGFIRYNSKAESTVSCDNAAKCPVSKVVTRNYD